MGKYSDEEVAAFIAFLNYGRLPENSSREDRVKIAAGAAALEDDLYQRYAPELIKDPIKDQELIDEKIRSLYLSDETKNFFPIFQHRLEELYQYFSRDNRTLPKYLIFALLKEHELIGQFVSSGSLSLIIAAEALTIRSEDIDTWLEKTGTPITDDEESVAIFRLEKRRDAS